MIVKGKLISHQAQLEIASSSRSEIGIPRNDICWKRVGRSRGLLPYLEDIDFGCNAAEA
jgi:hypothetical protein